MKKKILVLAVVVLVGFLIRGKLDEVYDKKQAQVGDGKVTEYTDGTRVGRELNYAENVPEDNKILQAFQSAFPGAEVLVACEEDLTNDGLKDLVVVYTIEADDDHEGITDLGNHRHVRLTVAVDSGNGVDYEFTEPIAAPVESQKIQFQNIDKKDEMEFVLQGQKNNKVGYGIYRVSDGKTINLFGEGMEDC